MADIFTKAKRSHVMSLIRSRGNQDTEVVLARLLRRHQITGWRRHLQLKIKKPVIGTTKLKTRTAKTGAQKRKFFILHSAFFILKVRPDFVFPKHKLAIFVDGCFWHGCPRHGTQPRGNRAFWQKKFATNIARDRRVNRALRRANWHVVRIWECALKRAVRTPKGEARLLKKLKVGR